MTIQVDNATIVNGEFKSHIESTWDGQQNCVLLTAGKGFKQSSMLIPAECVPDVVKLLKMYLGEMT